MTKGKPPAADTLKDIGELNRLLALGVPISQFDLPKTETGQYVVIMYKNHIKIKLLGDDRNLQFECIISGKVQSVRQSYT